MRYGSVCSGIEAATCAWNPLGWEAAWFAEIEKFPSSVLAHHYPDVPNLGDMTVIAARVRAGEVEAPDVLVGGTPCQAFSIAGLRGSMEDARGQLTLSFVKLADTIDESRLVRGRTPAIVVWENVPGVLSTADNAFGCFLGALAGEDRPLKPPGGRWSNAGCVFGPVRSIAWRITDAQYFGVAQRRRRVFVIASARDGFDPAAVLFEFDGVRRNNPPSRKTGQDVTGTIGSRTSGGGGFGTDFECAGGLTVSPALDQRAGRSGANSFATSEDLVPVAFGGGNTSGPIRTSTSTSTKTRNDFDTETFIVQENIVSGTLNANGKAAGSATQQDAENGMLVPVGFSTSGAGYWRDEIGALRGRPQDSHENVVLSVALRGREGGATAELGDEVATCLRASGGGGDKAHVLAPIAFDSRQDTISSTEVFGALGTSTPQAQAIAFSCKDNGRDATVDLSPTMRSMGHSGSHANGGGQLAVAHAIQAGALRTIPIGLDEEQNAMVDAFGTLKARTAGGGFEGTVMTQSHAVRRLTPVECERLQSFPDDYTFIPTWNGWRKMDSSETPESCISEGLEIKQNKKTGKWRVKDVDGPRYKAIGNSMCVNNMRWIGERIQMFIDKEDV